MLGQCAVTGADARLEDSQQWSLSPHLSHRTSALCLLRPTPLSAFCWLFCLIPLSEAPLQCIELDDRREEALGWRGSEGGLHLTLVPVYSGAAATVGTASARGAAPSRCPGPPWEPQVSGAASRSERLPVGRSEAVLHTARNSLIPLSPRGDHLVQSYFITPVPFLTESNFSSFPKCCV